MNISQEKQIERLTKLFFKKIEDRWNHRILKFVTGKTVLEIGCGYGQMTHLLNKHGIKSVGIDTDESFLSAGRKLFKDADLRNIDINNMPFKEEEFDTVIAKHIMHHLDLNESLKKIANVKRKELIVFDPNPTILVKACRKIVLHKDPSLSCRKLIAGLEKNNFKVEKIEYSDLFAMPLSGGFVGPQLIPEVNWLQNFLIKSDDAAAKLLKFLRFEKQLCWRYLVYAKKMKKFV